MGKVSIEELVIRGVDVSEQETTINFGRNDEEMEVYTSSNLTLTKIKRIFRQENHEWKLKEVIKDLDGNVVGVFFTAPKNLINFTSRKREGREFTEEERAELAEKMRSLRKKSE